jgi:hypothetical protein
MHIYKLPLSKWHKLVHILFLFLSHSVGRRPANTENRQDTLRALLVLILGYLHHSYFFHSFFFQCWGWNPGVSRMLSMCSTMSDTPLLQFCETSVSSLVLRQLPVDFCYKSMDKTIVPLTSVFPDFTVCQSVFSQFNSFDSFFFYVWIKYNLTKSTSSSLQNEARYKLVSNIK